MKRFASTLLTISTILISSTSIVSAQDYGTGSVRNERATMQDSVQESYITGERNVSRQDSRQMRTEDTDNETDATDISMQRSQQYCDMMANDSGCGQSNQQEHHSRHRRSSSN